MSAESEIQIFQIFYHPSQVDYLDNSFTPYDNTDNTQPDWCEYAIFRNEYFKGTCNTGLTGFLSWKFKEKTGVSGSQVFEWIRANPGYDVYFINPFMKRLRRTRSKNIWEHGEKCHPGLISLAQNLFCEAGFEIDIETLSMNPNKTLFCNFWIGTPDFWTRYMDFCEPLYQLIENKLSDQQKSRFLQQADRTGPCFIPYIFERLFSTLLCINTDIRAQAWHPDKSNNMSTPQWLMREIKRPIRRFLYPNEK
jgi:hypothetical protein